MAQKTKTELKAILVTGHTLSQQDCADLIDSVMFLLTENHLNVLYDTFGYTTFFAMIAPPSPGWTNVIMQAIGLFHPPQMTQIDPTTVDMSGNSIQIWAVPANWTAITDLNLNGNSLDNTSIENILVPLSLILHAIDIDIAGGTNASKSGWSAPALAAEAAIIANGGTVTSNP